MNEKFGIGKLVMCLWTHAKHVHSVRFVGTVIIALTKFYLKTNYNKYSKKLPLNL